MGKRLDAIWEETKLFYETHYTHPQDSRLRFKFKERPNDLQVMRLYKAKRQMEFYPETSYKNRPFSWNEKMPSSKENISKSKKKKKEEDDHDDTR